MERIRKIEQVGLALAAAALLLAPIASAQRAGMGGMMGGRYVRTMSPAIAFRAPTGFAVNRPGSLRTTASGTRPGVAAPHKAATGAYLLNGPSDPYLNSGGVPFYIDGVLNAGPGSAFFGDNSELGVKAFIDPATQLELATYERLQRNLRFSGIYLPLLPMYTAVPEDEDQSDEAYAQDQGQPEGAQPQVIIVQEEPPAADGNAKEQPSSPKEEQAPLPDEGEFLLIFRDGHSENAAAFTRSGNQVVYVTPDGMRQTVPLSEIDLEATQRTNQQRGTPLQID